MCFVLETKNGDQAHEYRPRPDALISLRNTRAAAFTASEWLMKVLFKISNILKLVYGCIKFNLNILTWNATSPCRSPVCVLQNLPQA